MEQEKKSKKNKVGIIILLIIIILGVIYFWMTKNIKNKLNFNADIEEVDTLNEKEYSPKAISAYKELSNLEKELDLSFEEINLDSI